jgi:hypothetical protein
MATTSTRSGLRQILCNSDSKDVIRLLSAGYANLLSITSMELISGSCFQGTGWFRFPIHTGKLILLWLSLLQEETTG